MDERGAARDLELRVGGIFGPYRLEAVLGSGAMGVVYLAEHRRLQRQVALKVLRPELTGDEVFRKRFLREARVAASVEHENLVPIVEAGEVAGLDYLASEYVAGHSLGDRLREAGQMPLDEVLRAAGEIGSALEALHHHGLVHRDVKPSNVMIAGSGRALLTDFGLAKGPAYTILTRPGQVVGTVEYLAPELIRGEAASPASDVYALGCLVFACLTGAPPFTGVSMFQVTMGHLDAAPPDPSVARPELDERLSVALLAALAKEPDRRPQSARQYALSLWLGARPGAG
jgi:serine/threonine-protein kinase